MVSEASMKKRAHDCVSASVCGGGGGGGHEREGERQRETIVDHKVEGLIEWFLISWQ